MSDDVEALAQVMHDTFITERTLGGWLADARREVVEEP